MIIKEKGLVLEKISKLYDFDGKSGVSTKVRVLIGSDVYSLRSTPETNDQIKESQEYYFTLTVRSRREVLSVELVSVEPVKK